MLTQAVSPEAEAVFAEVYLRFVFTVPVHACEVLLPGSSTRTGMCTVCGKLMLLPLCRDGVLDAEAERLYAQERQL
jgi:hypothetical protein